MNRFWVPHLYSCMTASDYELLYQKLSDHGIPLSYSTPWVDCFEKKAPTRRTYRVVPSKPAQVPPSGMTPIGTHESCHIYVDGNAKEHALSNMGYYTGPLAFLILFPLVIYLLITFLPGAAVLTPWILTLAIIIFAAHFLSLFLLWWQKHHVLQFSTRSVLIAKIAFSVLVNVLQVVLLVLLCVEAAI